MKTATRIKNIAQANINQALDKMEKPQQMINLMIDDMEGAVRDLKASIGSRTEAKLQAELEKKVVEKSIARWADRAKMAVERNRDDLAKEALLEKMRAEKDLEILSIDLEQFEKLNRDGRGSIVELEEKLELVRQRQRLLIQRGVHAAEKKHAHETLRKAESNEAYRRFLELEAKIEKIEAEAEVSGFPRTGEHEETFSEMENAKAVGEELAQLKKSAKTEKQTKE